jgi:transcriptional antiterminator RfaH
LLAWGVQAFLPRLRPSAALRRVAGQRVRPLFPGYLFARFNASSMLHKIRYTRGVARVLGSEMGPTPVDESIITLMRQQTGPDGFVRLSFNAGDRVRIVDGPLRDFVGVFTNTLTSADRVRVLLTAVNGRFSVVVNHDMLERVVVA